ncbi:OmpW family protein [Siccirubricoccus sp. KC 17139]|uniref:OmpW family protein n=1 Tax=Siccirubricoccus soli TaxID=2899147 RepID=A0ABT1DC24_9PROT|nr:OmpW family outer membrane protein [Siccirubricoccus soli]MCO6419484.1 OmpW family protein [Siccirubricoccus soli]MCP2685619.1 OmpW family protein [Siccirubricoccus soli]
MMSRMIRSMLGGAAIAAALAGAAMAEDGVRGKRAGDVVIGFGAIGVLPGNGGGDVSPIGGKVHASNGASPQFDVTYFATPNIAFNLIAATTQHDIQARGSAAGRPLSLGHVWALPPTLTMQYHPFPNARFSPYLGAGLNYTWFYGYGGHRDAIVNRVRVDSAPGFALVVGLDYEIAPNWLANIDVKKIFLRPTASVNSGAVNARVELDPLILGASIRYRF